LSELGSKLNYLISLNRQITGEQTMQDKSDSGRHSFAETVEIAGDQLVAKVKELIKEGNVRRLIIRHADGHVLLEIPLTTGLAVGGVTTVIAPVLVALGAMAALIASFKIEVVRQPEGPKEHEKT
jgi:hypothetical protein